MLISSRGSVAKDVADIKQCKLSPNVGSRGFGTELTHVILLLLFPS